MLRLNNIEKIKAKKANVENKITTLKLGMEQDKVNILQNKNMLGVPDELES